MLALAGSNLSVCLTLLIIFLYYSTQTQSARFTRKEIGQNFPIASGKNGSQNFANGAAWHLVRGKCCGSKILWVMIFVGMRPIFVEKDRATSIEKRRLKLRRNQNSKRRV